MHSLRLSRLAMEHVKIAAKTNLIILRLQIQPIQLTQPHASQDVPPVNLYSLVAPSCWGSKFKLVMHVGVVLKTLFHPPGIMTSVMV